MFRTPVSGFFRHSADRQHDRTGSDRLGIVVGTETSRALMESTIEMLCSDISITRKSLKPAFAPLTIGSGSAAVLLTNDDLTRTGIAFGGTVLADSRYADLCRSQVDVTAGVTHRGS